MSLPNEKIYNPPAFSILKKFSDLVGDRNEAVVVFKLSEICEKVDKNGIIVQRKKLKANE